MDRENHSTHGDVFGPLGSAAQPHVSPDIDQDSNAESDRNGIDRQSFGRPEDKSRGRKKRWGFWPGVRFLLSGPASTIGMDGIRESASVIGALTRRVRTGPQDDRRVHAYDDRSLDLEAMAYDAGISVARVRVLLGNRRRETKRLVFSYLAGAIAFFVLWIWQASETSAYTRLPYVVVLLPICGLFCLSAFYNALVNWQCRTERLGTWREFLSSRADRPLPATQQRTDGGDMTSNAAPTPGAMQGRALQALA
jgi:hypothetical protein